MLLNIKLISWLLLTSILLVGCELSGTQDTTQPIIDLTGDNPMLIALGDCYVEQGATAFDNIDGDLSENIMIDVSSLNTSAVGSYSVSYQVSDKSGNYAEEKTRLVSVVDSAVDKIAPDIPINKD